jgi:hypothetical protein
VSTLASTLFIRSVRFRFKSAVMHYFRRTLFFRASLLLLFGFPARADDRVLIDATVNGVPISFAIDTGAGGGLIIWAATAKRLGLKIIPPPSNIKPLPGKALLSKTVPCTLEVLGENFLGTELEIFDDQETAFLGCDGVIGWGLLKQHGMVLSLADHKLLLSDEIPDDLSTWSKLRIRTDLPTLCLEVPSKSQGAKVIEIDTGNFAGVALPPSEWEKWVADHPKQRLTARLTFMPGAGNVGDGEGWADKFSIGDLFLTEVPVNQSNIAQRIDTGGASYGGSLGLAALKRIDLVINSAKGVAYAKPRTEPAEPYPHNRLGAIFTSDDTSSGPLVAHPFKGSPAYRAGIREGDRLLQIDSVDVTSWRTRPSTGPLDSTYWYRPAGSKSTLLLRRGSQTYSVNVVLENIIGPDASAQN